MAFQEFSKNLLKYFNGTIILTYFLLPPLDLNDSESAKFSFGPSLQ